MLIEFAGHMCVIISMKVDVENTLLNGCAYDPIKYIIYISINRKTLVCFFFQAFKDVNGGAVAQW
jgi:hypothetical protein